MQYTIYTDGASDPVNPKMASSYMIVTNTTYITAGATGFKGNNITVAEIAAIGLAVEKLMSAVELTEYDKVTIRTDSQVAIEFFNGASLWLLREPLVELSHKKLKELGSKCQYRIQKINAHQSETNGNKVADRLAKYCLSMVLRK